MLFTRQMDILNMLGLGGPQTQQASQQLGVAPDQMNSALEAAVPLLLSKLTQNAADPQQAQALASAVEQHDGSTLEAFQQGNLPNLNEGQGIVRHVFGEQQDSAAYAVAQRAGVSPQVAMQILAMVAPLVMAYLGRNRGGAGGNLSGLGSILGSVLGGGGLGSILGSVLGGSTGGIQQQDSYQQGQYQQAPYQQPQQQQGGDLGSIVGSILGGLDGGQSQQPQGQNAQQGGIFGNLNDVLGGNHGALDDLIGMFGGKR